VATLQTNQKALDSNNIVEASKSLRAFSVPSELQANALALAWTPPRMLPFESNPVCHICSTRFTMFRRPTHCRNCGVCICKDCTSQWPSKMLPDTYNRKKESTVHVCKSCEWLCNEFRLALLQGEFDKSVSLHATGNVNLQTPFANVKGELLYPVHCAVLGKSLPALRWLADIHCCPIKVCCCEIAT
jgi:FYVE zinc finger